MNKFGRLVDVVKGAYIRIKRDDNGEKRDINVST